jgi:hypothetical protein
MEKIWILDGHTLKFLRQLPVRSGCIAQIELTANDFIALALDEHAVLRIVDLTSGRLLGEIVDSHGNSVYPQLVLSPNDEAIVVATRSAVRVHACDFCGAISPAARVASSRPFRNLSDRVEKSSVEKRQ